MDVSASMQYSGMSHIDQYLALIEQYIIKLFSAKSRRLNQDLIIDKNIKLFLSAFGLNHPFPFLTTAKNSVVENILSNKQQQSPISLASFINHWQHYKQQIAAIAPMMYGTSAMLEGLQKVNVLFEDENQQQTYGNKILILVSDGNASHSSDAEIVDAIAHLQQNNVLVISLHLSLTEEIAPKHIYAQAEPHWAAQTQLMFDCASYMSQDSFLFSYLRGHGWQIPSYGKLLMPINPQRLINHTYTSYAHKRQNRRKKQHNNGIFIAYSQQDTSYLTQLKQLLVPLESQSTLHLYSDVSQDTIAAWLYTLENALRHTQVVILLISPAFMASAFMLENSLVALLERAKRRGTAIIPLILESSRFRYNDCLNIYPTINSYNQPLNILNPQDQKAIMNRLLTRTEQHLKVAKNQYA
jgi:hypothetical protein